VKAGPPTAADDIELEIAGMTCAACARRIEKKLNKLDGVNAQVNYATEKAAVRIPTGYDARALIAEVEKVGYTAALPQQEPVSQTAETAATTDDAELTSLRIRLVAAVVLAVPVIAMAMIPALQFRYWQWASLALAAPVVVWAGRPFHTAAWANLRHGAATMDTLVSVGTLSAFLWSLYALFLGTAGQPGMHHGFELTVTRGDGAGNIYLEVAAGVTLFVLAGRYFEKRSKRRAGAALRAWCSWAPRTSRCCAPTCRAPRPASPSTSWRWATSSWCARAKRSPPTGPSSRDPRPWTPRCSPVSPSPSRSARATPSPVPP
jgi:Cu+-exporting ATPase